MDEKKKIDKPKPGMVVAHPVLTPLQLETRFWEQNYLDLV